jgi:cbb3-type cytochrome oxidase maturation protein
MNIIFFTLGVSLLLSVSFLALFLWSTKKGQYDDLVTPGHRVLVDEKDINTKSVTEENSDE